LRADGPNQVEIARIQMTWIYSLNLVYLVIAPSSEEINKLLLQRRKRKVLHAHNLTWKKSCPVKG